MWLRDFDNRQEPIATARNCVNISRAIGFIEKGLPKAPHGRVDATFEIDIDAVWPKEILDVLAGDHFAGSFEKDGEDAGGLILEPDQAAGLGENTPVRTKVEGAGAILTLR